MDFLRFLESIRTPLGEKIFYVITYGGEEITLLGLICVLYWCIDRKLGYRMTYAYLSSALAINTLKLICRVPRPWVRDTQIHPVKLAMPSADGYSFPSGHTQNATALFGTLFHITRKRALKILFALIIPAVMFSRLYLCVHTPTDVLVSFCVSLCIITGLNLIADKVELTKGRKIFILCILLLLALATLIYTYVLYSSGTIEYIDASASFKGCGAGFGFAIGWYIESTYIQFETKCKNIGMQILKLAIGAGVALLLKSGIKHVAASLFGQHFLTDVIRYFVVMIWAFIIMPLIIKKFFQEKPSMA